MIAIDPGATAGWAVFDRRELVEAGAWPRARVLSTPPFVEDCSVVVLEYPRIYPQGRHPSDPNKSVRPLILMVGDLQGFYRRRGVETELVEPKKWKGQVPKEVHHRRMLKRLSAAEADRMPRRPRAQDHDHNMLDAVALGLWKLQRM